MKIGKYLDEFKTENPSNCSGFPDGSRITNADVDGDGKLALIELEYWYRNGGGKAININASSLSMDGVDPNLFKGMAVGTKEGVNLLFSDFWGGEGA